MRYYETLFVVNPNFEHAKLTQVIDAVKKEISRNEGTILNIDEWGKKRLAYPIENHKYGIYVLIQFESQNHGLVRELENWLKLSTDIIASLVARLKSKPEVEEDAKQA